MAQNALTLGLSYAKTRIQFGKPIIAFPRVSAKLAMMAVETMLARQLTYFAAREKDAGRRCDLEAGMAKLLGARIAWANADMARSSPSITAMILVPFMLSLLLKGILVSNRAIRSYKSSDDCS